MTKDIEREAFEALPLAKLALSQDWVRYHKESNTYYPNEDFCPESAPETINFAWQSWQAAKAQAVPEVKDIGNELQSWVAVWSFKARHDREDYIVVDANLLAEKIEKLTGANA